MTCAHSVFDQRSLKREFKKKERRRYIDRVSSDTRKTISPPFKSSKTDGATLKTAFTRAQWYTETAASRDRTCAKRCSLCETPGARVPVLFGYVRSRHHGTYISAIERTWNVLYHAHSYSLRRVAATVLSIGLETSRMPNTRAITSRAPPHDLAWALCIVIRSGINCRIRRSDYMSTNWLSPFENGSCRTTNRWAQTLC